MENQLIKIRVYRRDYECIFLRWSLRDLSDDQKVNYSVGIEKSGHFEPAKYSCNKDIEKFALKIEPNTETICIPHKDNVIKFDEDCLIRVVFGSQDSKQLEVRRNVFPKGVLSSEEEDVSKRNSHLFGFREKRRKWAKIPLVEYNGQLAIPVMIVNADQMKEINSKKRVMMIPSTETDDRKINT